MQRPTIGRIVHFVLPNGEHRPAIIVRVWSPTCVQLQVFTDAGNDGFEPVEWRTSVEFDEDGFSDTWHWPEREESTDIPRTAEEAKAAAEG